MTVRELREILEDFNENDEVMATYNYGDYWKTMVAKPIESVEDGVVEHSSYHQCDKVLADEDIMEQEVTEGKQKMVVLLKL